MSKRSLAKAFFMFVFALSFLFSGYLLTLVETPSVKQKLAFYKAWYNPSEVNIDNYLKITNSTETLDLNKTFDSLTKTNTNLYALYKDKREVRDPIAFKSLVEEDGNIPQGSSYVAQGIQGYHRYEYDLLLMKNREFSASKYLNTKYSKVNPIDEVSYSGSKTIQDYETNLKTKFTDLIEALKNGNNSELPKVDKAEKLENLEITKIENIEKVILDEGVDSYEVSKLTISMGNCGRENILEIDYLFKDGEFEFGNIEAFVEKLCRKQYVTVNGVLVGTCEDCTYYPADKTHALRPDYEPQVTAISFASGGQFINTKAYNDFYDMYQAAKSAGYIINVTSGYRSYISQQATFESWVAYEMSMGKSRAAAEAAANTYSARPGFSEHQLGTALDLNSGGCGLTGGCNGNLGLWEWLKNNAHNYGFVISYPEGKESQTGYIFEPWHYRWLGKELAAEYKKVESSTWLAEWLREKGLF